MKFLLTWQGITRPPNMTRYIRNCSWPHLTWHTTQALQLRGMWDPRAPTTTLEGQAEEVLTYLVQVLLRCHWALSRWVVNYPKCRAVKNIMSQVSTGWMLFMERKLRQTLMFIPHCSSQKLLTVNYTYMPRYLPYRRDLTIHQTLERTLSCADSTYFCTSF